MSMAEAQDTPVKGVKKGQKMASREIRRPPVSPGRPRAVLDEVLLLGLAAMGWGYKRIAREYAARTGQYVSHSTVRTRLAPLTASRDRR